MRFAMRGRFLVGLLGLGMLLGSGYPSPAQSSSQSAEPQYDPYQRSGDVLYMNRMGKSGWERGKEIWYMKCWICHNDYTIEANDPNEGPVAPKLTGLYQRPMLLSGQPVNDDTVKAKIREGGLNMPAYRHVLTDKDLNELVEYLRDHCCWDEHNPPPNPRFPSANSGN